MRQAKAGGIELRDAANAAHALPNRLPGLLRSDADGSQQAHARYYHSS